MSDSELVSAADSRAIVRLLGEVCVHSGDATAQKRYLMDGLCEIIDADRWAWGLAARMEPNQPSVHLSLLHGGFTETSYAAFTQAYNHPEMSGVHARFATELAEKRCHLTQLRQQMDPDSTYKTTGAYRYWQEADIDGVIMSLRPLDDTTFSIMGLYRSHAGGLFTPRENRIAHILLSEVPGLHAAGWPDDRGITLPELSNRERTTMALLVQGYSRQKIAGHLEISIHTLNDYVKQVFKHFCVHSQAELIARFRKGDGGDA